MNNSKWKKALLEFFKGTQCYTRMLLYRLIARKTTVHNQFDRLDLCLFRYMPTRFEKYLHFIGTVRVFLTFLEAVQLKNGVETRKVYILAFEKGKLVSHMSGFKS